MTARALSGEFRGLCDAATPAPWYARERFVEGRFTPKGVIKTATGIYFSVVEGNRPRAEADAAFTAFCSNHRAAIGAALELAEAVDADHTDEKGTKWNFAHEPCASALARWREAVKEVRP